MAGMVMSDPDSVGVFKMGMSVAPVTDWRYIDYCCAFNIDTSGLI